MIEILAIRHAATEWNQQKRLQGRQDIPLSPAGHQVLSEQICPIAFSDAQWFCSPLLRAQQTAKALGIDHYTIEPALIEMHWGDWEGQTLPELRQQLGATMEEQEAKGLDLQPPNGESPRQVQQRLHTWLSNQTFADKAGIVCHKGVLRALLSLALNWDMRGDCPVKVNWQQALLFQWNLEQGLSLKDYNLPLESFYNLS